MEIKETIINKVLNLNGKELEDFLLGYSALFHVKEYEKLIETTKQGIHTRILQTIIMVISFCLISKVTNNQLTQQTIMIAVILGTAIAGMLIYNNIMMYKTYKRKVESYQSVIDCILTKNASWDKCIFTNMLNYSYFR